MEKIKTYVLDTNILLESPNAIFGFKENNVVITGTTLQELDDKKNKPGETGFNAREVCRLLENLREKGNLLTGVSLENGGRFCIETNGISEKNLPKGYSIDIPDNRIISACLSLKEKMRKADLILVTNDISMRINASVCGLSVESYRNSQIKSKNPYTGRVEIELANADIINLLYKEKEISLAELEKDLDKLDLRENEFVILKYLNQSALGIHKENTIKLIQNKSVFGVKPKNAAQTFALYALTAPVEELPIVILKGPAGTAKTFLSLAAGLEESYESSFKSSDNRNAYDKLLITRNNATIPGEDFGYLPGTMKEKMMPLLSPFFDNMEALLRNNCKEESNEQIQMQIEDMFESGIVNVCPIAYMRGRSISNSYLIVDECQNVTRSQMRDIITRIGKGTKLVLCGDPAQIDNHLLDKWNNGLVFASEKMKDSKLCAQITFDEKESVRSPLAAEALKRLEI